MMEHGWLTPDLYLLPKIFLINTWEILLNQKHVMREDFTLKASDLLDIASARR
jgi:hypothetical protein